MLTLPRLCWQPLLFSAETPTRRPWLGQAQKDLTFTFTREEIIQRDLNEPTFGVG